MATYATLTVPVADIIGANFNESRASVWIEPNVPVVLADKIRVGGRREQVVNGVATFANLVTTNSADNPASFGYRVTITAPPKGAQKREDIVTLTTSDFPFTATANLKDIPEAWDNIAIPAEWRSAFRDEMNLIAGTAASSATSAAASAEIAQNLVISDLGTTDGQTRALIEAPASQTATALSATSVSPTPGGLGATLMQTYAQDDGRINAKDKRLGTWGSEASIINALDAAEDTGLRKGTVVYFPAGPYQHVYDVGDGLSMAGRTSQIQGGGAYITTAGDWFGTVFHATTQSGPVIDFAGWENPAAFQGRVTHSGFVVKGSGVADPTKENAGLHFSYLGSTTFSDIAICDTGGPGLYGAYYPGNAVYLCDFERITINTPVAAKANDVPWVYFNEANLVTFSQIGLRHVGPGPGSVGVSGAVVIDSPSGTSPSGQSTLTDWWLENLWAPDKGTLISVKGNYHLLRDVRFVDCYKEVGATETSHVRFHAPATGDEGGNMWRGLIPGRNPDFPADHPSLDWGIDNRQSYNAFDGVKGRNGYNVVHRGSSTPAGVGTFPDVIHNAVTLHGSQKFADGPGVTDQSPSATGIYQNRHIDFCAGAIKGFTVTA